MQNKPIVHYRRYHGYDYSRGAVLFITFGLAARRPVFGAVARCGDGGARVDYNAVGRAAVETMQLEMKRTGDLVVHRFGLMPDHVHLRLFIRPGTREPLARVGALVRNFKRWSKWKAGRLGCQLEWEPNYHDRVCVSADIIDLVDKYIDNNPLKWALMHGPSPPLRVVEPFDSPRLPSGEWWTAAGAADLLGGGQRLAGFQLSRSIPPGQVDAVVARCLAAARKGFVPVSTFISPAERALQRALVAAKAPMVRVVPDALATVYRPRGDEPRQFAEGRLLLLSRVAAAGQGRSAAWHGINDAIVDLVCPPPRPCALPVLTGPALQAEPPPRPCALPVLTGPALQAEPPPRPCAFPVLTGPALQAEPITPGAAVYVVLNRATGRVEWRFRSKGDPKPT